MLTISHAVIYTKKINASSSFLVTKFTHVVTFLVGSHAVYITEH